jgi:hypothetical protein
LEVILIVAVKLDVLAFLAVIQTASATISITCRLLQAYLLKMVYLLRMLMTQTEHQLQVGQVDHYLVTLLLLTPQQDILTLLIQ